jgi:opacity protein-like surface antigen
VRIPVLALRGLLAVAVALTLLASPAAAQVTPAAGYTPPDDTPAIRVGATIFADYTVQQKPKIFDVDNNEVTSNAFNISRAYINVTGNLSHIIAFRVTPDIVRETTTGSAINGSLTFRLKYAYAQFNLDDWMNRGSWVRLGMQQTPWVDFMENVWRYRFQGTIFEDREGFLSSSDLGVSFRYNLPGNYGDIHTGFYNGETYSRSEVNDQKGFMIRGTFRPLRQRPVLRGLRATGFYDKDAYVKNAERERAIAAVTFEHPHLNAAFDYLWASDQTRTSATAVDARGFSVWATPRFTRGWEAIVRFDHLEPNTELEARKNRTIGGVSYWFPLQGTVSTALLFDIETVNYDDFAPARPDERRFALHMLVNF